jgi:Bacterial PH domain
VACMLGVGIAFTTLLIDTASAGKGVLGTVVVVLVFGGTAAFGRYLAVRFAVQGVLVDEVGVLIRNGLRSHRLRWEDIDHFEYARCDPWPRVGVAVLRTGRRIAMVSLQRGYVGHFPEQAVEALNRERQEHEARATPA